MPRKSTPPPARGRENLRANQRKHRNAGRRKYKPQANHGAVIGLLMVVAITALGIAWWSTNHGTNSAPLGVVNENKPVADLAPAKPQEPTAPTDEIETLCARGEIHEAICLWIDIPNQSPRKEIGLAAIKAASEKAGWTDSPDWQARWGAAFCLMLEEETFNRGRKAFDIDKDAPEKLRMEILEIHLGLGMRLAFIREDRHKEQIAFIKAAMAEHIADHPEDAKYHDWIWGRPDHCPIPYPPRKDFSAADARALVAGFFETARREYGKE